MPLVSYWTESRLCTGWGRLTPQFHYRNPSSELHYPRGRSGVSWVHPYHRWARCHSHPREWLISNTYRNISRPSPDWDRCRYYWYWSPSSCVSLALLHTIAQRLDVFPYCLWCTNEQQTTSPLTPGQPRPHRVQSRSLQRLLRSSQLLLLK